MPYRTMRAVSMPFAFCRCTEVNPVDRTPAAATHTIFKPTCILACQRRRVEHFSQQQEDVQ
jgi:hypothetical protein